MHWPVRMCSELFDEPNTSYWESGRIYLNYFSRFYDRYFKSIGVDTDRNIFTVDAHIIERDSNPYADHESSEEDIPPSILECAMCKNDVSLKKMSWIRMTPEGEVVETDSILEDAKWHMVCFGCSKKLPDEFKHSL